MPSTAPKIQLIPHETGNYRLDRSRLPNNIQLLDEANHVRWQAIIKKQYSKIDSPQASIGDTIDNLIKWGKLPSNYYQRLIVRQLAQGVDIPQEILEQHQIVILDGMPEPLVRRKPENRQPTSPIDFVLVNPKKWQEHPNLVKFYNALPKKPYCAFAKDGQSLIRNKDKAISLPYIQPNHPLWCNMLVFDIDEQQGLDAFTAWQDANLPPPNIIVKNPIKNSCHYIYLLQTGVALANKASKKAIKYINAIHARMTHLLNADPSYTGGRTKNPLSRKHDTFVNAAMPYTLDELASKLDLDEQPYSTPKKESEPKNGYLGRNCELFDYVRHYGYKKHHLSHDALLNYLMFIALEYNSTNFSEPLDSSEVEAICKSITKFCKSERFGFSNSEASRLAFSNIQRIRGARGNAVGACSKGGKARSASYEPKREQAQELHKQGVKIKDIANHLKITRQTLSNWGIKSRGKKM